MRAAESNPDLRLGSQVFADDTTLAQAQARYDAAISQVDMAAKEPGLFDRIVGGFVDGVKDFASAAVKWAQDHADLIAQFGGLMNKVSTVLGVLAIITAPFEPVGAVFAAAAAGTSLNSWQDWPHVCDLALDVFESLCWDNSAHDQTVANSL